MLMNLLSYLQLIPMLVSEGGIGAALEGFDFVGVIFGFLNQLTFLVDAFIAAAFFAAIIRSIFKSFWKVVWRGIIFIILVIILFSFVGMFAPTVGQLPVSIKGTAGGTAVEWTNLAQVINGVSIKAGYSDTYALALTEVVLKNLTIWFGIMAIGIITPIISGITFPLFNLLLPKKLKDLKLIPARFAISIGLTLIAVMIFAIPMATLVPPMTAFKAAITEDTLMYKFLNPEVIGFLELFTTEQSILLKIVNLGNVAGSLNMFSAFKDGATTINLSDALPELFQQLNTIPFVEAASA